MSFKSPNHHYFEEYKSDFLEPLIDNNKVKIHIYS